MVGNPLSGKYSVNRDRGRTLSKRPPPRPEARGRHFSKFEGVAGICNANAERGSDVARTARPIPGVRAWGDVPHQFLTPDNFARSDQATLPVPFRANEVYAGVNPIRQVNVNLRRTKPGPWVIPRYACDPVSGPRRLSTRSPEVLPIHRPR